MSRERKCKSEEKQLKESRHKHKCNLTRESTAKLIARISNLPRSLEQLPAQPGEHIFAVILSYRQFTLEINFFCISEVYFNCWVLCQQWSIGNREWNFSTGFGFGLFLLPWFLMLSCSWLQLFQLSVHSRYVMFPWAQQKQAYSWTASSREKALNSNLPVPAV